MKNVLFCICFFVTLTVLSFAATTTAQETIPPENTNATLTIDTKAPSMSYDPMIFGGFIEHFHDQIYGGLFEPGSPLSDEKGFRKDVIKAMKELKLSVVRWPGGCFASGYHWLDGVGKNRRPTPDPVWGVVDPNTFGTDEFVEWCRLVGCEPYICTNAGNGTPQEMKDWVEYCNGNEGKFAELRKSGGHLKPLNVKYWSVGNENWGGHEIGCRTAEEWGPLVDKSARLMLEADPNLTLMAAATGDPNWTVPLLKNAGKNLDYVCVHAYWLPFWENNRIPDYLTCIMQSNGPEGAIQGAINAIEAAGFRGRVKIAFDEWNLRGWHHPGFPRKKVQDSKDPDVLAKDKALINARDKNAIAMQYTMADALFSASFLNSCLRHAEDVGMANIAPIVNTRGPLYVHSKGIVKRTTFHTLAMYANELESRVGKLKLESSELSHDNQAISIVDAIATVDESGKAWSVAIVNRHPEKAVTCTIKLDDKILQGTYPATILTGNSPDAYNDIQHPNRVMPEKRELEFKNGNVCLPAHSLTIVRIKN